MRNTIELRFALRGAEALDEGYSRIVLGVAVGPDERRRAGDAVIGVGGDLAPGAAGDGTHGRERN